MRKSFIYEISNYITPASLCAFHCSVSPVGYLTSIVSQCIRLAEHAIILTYTNSLSLVVGRVYGFFRAVQAFLILISSLLKSADVEFFYSECTLPCCSELQLPQFQGISLQGGNFETPVVPKNVRRCS